MVALNDDEHNRAGVSETPMVKGERDKYIPEGCVDLPDGSRK